MKSETLAEIPEHLLLYQWGCAGEHRHNHRHMEPHNHGEGTESVTVGTGRPHHHHDERCAPPPLLRLMAWWCNLSMFQLIAWLKSRDVFLGGSRKG